MSNPDLHAGRRATQPALDPSKLDRLPPSCPQSELALLGCALLDPQYAPDLRLEWFYDLRHRSIAEAMLDLTADGSPVDVGTVAQRRPEFTMLVSEAMAACHSPANWPHWRDILVEKLTLRRVIQAAQSAQAAAYDPAADVDLVVDEFERDAMAVRQGDNAGSDLVDTRATLRELTDEYERNATEGKPRGLRTGFHELDKITGGLKPQQLFVIAARPSIGKTSLALNVAEHLALVEGVPVGFFSLEMSGKELLHRLACSNGRVDSTALSEGKPTDRDIRNLTVAQSKIAKAPLHICDRGGLTIAQLTGLARRMVQRHSIKLLIVDYLGLLRSGDKGRSRYEETTLVSNALKMLAKELGLPVVALAQLNRESDKVEGAPKMSHLRDSGAIEQDADIVGLLHKGEDETGDAQPVSLIIAKNRSGRTGKVNLVFLRSITRFEDASPIQP